jgi:hypothetical protein
MIEPGEALRELLAQHDMLRAIIDRCVELADDLDRGSGEPDRLVREVARLRVAFAVHNGYEEGVIPAILRELDAFGEVRVASMLADHAAEHASLRVRLAGPTTELRAALRELREHLATEEEVYLCARVLRDDLVALESSS